MPGFSQFYSASPYPIKVIAANLRGLYLRWWRYGSVLEEWSAQVLERETWNPEQWKTWREEKLAYTLYRAATRVPYYQKYWLEKRTGGDKSSFERLENWPVLKKKDVLENPFAFVADDCDIRKMYQDRTSGTTGSPLKIFSRRKTIQEWYSLHEARTRGWHGVSMKERWGIFGGQLIIPFGQKKPPYWVYNAALNQVYFSTHHISRETAAHYVDALQKYAPTHLVVYPSSAVVLARAILEQNLIPPNVKVIFSNAELLTDSVRNTIQSAFKCPVVNTYGMGEIVAAASECQEGSFHIWPEVGHVEVFDDLADVPTPSEGRLIATGLLNTDMPLIRYDTGDRIMLEQQKQCGCGRTLPIFGALVGRQNDLIITPEGRYVFWLNPVFYGMPVIESQIIQENNQNITIKVVPAPGFSAEDELEIARRCKQRVGDMHISVEKVEAIPRGPNGKFKAVVSLLEKSHVP